MKKSRRKQKTCQWERDLWDGSKIYMFWGLSVDRLKHKLKHLPKKDVIVRKKLEEVLEHRTRKNVWKTKMESKDEA